MAAARDGARRLLPAPGQGLPWLARATVVLTLTLVALDATGLGQPGAIDPNEPLPGDVTTLPVIPEGPTTWRVEPRPRPGDQRQPFEPGSRPRGREGAVPQLPEGLGPLPPHQGQAMAFTLVEAADGTVYAVASGVFAAGTAEAFRRFDEANERRIEVVVFDSPGGLVHEAIALGRHLRERGLAALVPEEGLCASACPLAFAGGRERIAHPAAWVGVHRAYLDPAASEGDRQTGIGEGQQLAALCLEYLAEMEIDPAAWIPALSTPWSQVYFYTREELLETRLATSVEAI